MIYLLFCLINDLSNFQLLFIINQDVYSVLSSIRTSCSVKLPNSSTLHERSTLLLGIFMAYFQLKYFIAVQAPQNLHTLSLPLSLSLKNIALSIFFISFLPFA